VVRVGIGADGSGASKSKVDRRNDLARLVARELGLPDVIATRVPAAYVLLIPLSKNADMAAIRHVRSAVTAATTSTHAEVPVSAVISTVCRNIDDFPRAHRELRSLFETLEQLGQRGRVVLAGELGVLRLLALSTPHQEAVAFARDLLAPLLAYDSETGSALTGTLRVLLQQGGQIRATAKALGVHENTIRYRLSRVRELSAFDPEQIGSLLDLRFAFQILELCGALDGAPAEIRGTAD
jgi:sugar diacid utilization regulator